LTERIKESAARGLFFAAACVSMAAVAVICLFLFSNGLPFIAKTGLGSFIGGKIWKPTNGVFGIFPMIVGSLYVTAGAVLIGVPAGVFTAMYITYFASKRIKRAFKPVINLLAGIPSVVYGFFGLVVIVPFIRHTFGGNGSSVLAASILLGVMILPTIISVSASSLEAVPSSYFEGSLALGASREQSVYFTVVPAARSGITAGIILGTGRAIGETMAVIMVAGNQARIPSSILKGVRTLTANIVIEMGYAAELHREALIATAVVLFVFILLINLLFSIVKNRTAR
jgi:phosphate transport system permease protein